MLAPKLRHRIGIDLLTETQDPITGAITENWTPFATDEPAEILPISSGEILRADAGQSTARYRFIVRQAAVVGVSGKMRITHEGMTFNIIGEPIPDPTLRRWVTFTAEAGLRDG